MEEECTSIAEYEDPANVLVQNVSKAVPASIVDPDQGGDISR